MNLLEDLTMLLLNFNFVMSYIIHKVLILLTHHMNYVKDDSFKCFFMEYNIISF